jgi:cell division protein FtsX
MLRFIKVLILALCAAVLLGFAFANREFVTVSFDPFSTTDNAAFSIPAPLFAVVIVAAMLGVVAGALATWLSQRRYRKASRQSRMEADKWRAQAQALKTATHAALPSDR